MSKITHHSDTHEQHTPKKKQALLPKIIIVLLGVGMAGFGTDSFGVGGSTPDAAMKVGNTIMTNNELQNIKSQIKSQLPNIDNDELQKFTTLRAKSQLAMVNYIDDAGFSISEKELSKRVKSTFSDESGKFDRALFDRYLNRSGLTAEQLQTQLGQDAFNEVIINSAIVSEVELVPILAMNQPTRDVSVIEIQPARYFADQTATEAEVNAYFKAHAREFDIPEKVALTYIDLDKANIEIDKKITDDDLKAAYETYLQATKDSEQRKSSYLLFGENQKLAENVATDLAAGKLTWDNAQTKYKSEIEDTGEFDFTSKANAESPEIGDALFSIVKKGKTSQAINSQYGYLILRLDDITASDTPKSLDELKPELTEAIIKERRHAKFNKQLEAVESIAFATGASFDSIQEALNVVPQKTGLIDRNASEGILKLPKVRNALLDEEKKLKPVNTFIEPIEISDSRFIVIKLDQYEPAKPQTLADVKAAVTQAATAEKRSKLTDDLAKSIQTELKAGKSLTEIASANKLSVKKLTNLNFQKLPEGNDLMLGIQLLQLPVVLGPENAQIFDTNNGAKAVAVTNHVTLADLPDTKTLNNTAIGFAQRIGQNDLQRLMNAIIENTEFKIYDTSLAK